MVGPLSTEEAATLASELHRQHPQSTLLPMSCMPCFGAIACSRSQGMFDAKSSFRGLSLPDGHMKPQADLRHTSENTIRQYS